MSANREYKTQKDTRNSVWEKAAIIGSLWAAIEIILGSFLHNLNIPFTGTILASIGVFLMTASSVRWKEKGLIIRIGLICAIMKSVSPSAVIFGPMIGILLEALIFELSTLLIGRKIAGYMIGGGLAVASVLLHQIINLLITYGYSIVGVYNNIYKLAINNIGNPGISPGGLILVLFAVEFTIGAITAGMAFHIKKPENIYYIKNEDYGKSHYNFISAAGGTSVYLLLVNLLSVILLLFSFKYLSLSYSILLTIIFIFYGYRRYHIITLNKPGYIMEFGLIILFSGLISNNPFSQGYGMSTSGIYAGIEMILRALVIITGFSIISCELSNPVITNWMFKRKFVKLYNSLELAFSFLPMMTNIISDTSQVIKKPSKTISYLLSIADLMIRRTDLDNTVFVISGPINSGKSSLLEEIINIIRQKNIRTGGIISKAVFKEGKKTGYDLMNISSRECIPFMRVNEKELPDHNDDVSGKKYIDKIGKYYISTKGFLSGNEILLNDIIKKFDIIVVDEIGPMEIGGKLWAEPLREILKMKNKLIILVIRENIMDAIFSEFDIYPEKIFFPAEDKEKVAESLFKSYEKLKSNFDKNN